MLGIEKRPFGGQQDALNQHLQGLTQSSINLTFGQLRTLVFIIAGTLLITIVLYRVIATTFFKTRPPYTR